MKVYTKVAAMQSNGCPLDEVWVQRAAGVKPLPFRATFAVVLALLASAPAPRAEDAPKGAPAPHADDAAKKTPPPHVALPADVTTEHTLTLAGRALAYRATAGSLPISDAKGEHKADMFYVAYALDGQDAAARPITFAFNGGPGAASAYLHLGAIGPRVLAFTDDLETLSTARRLIDNPETWLDLTDLVFVDPVGAGYSRGTGSDEEVAKQFWGVKQDAEAMAAFVRLYLTRAGRLGSPKYLVGESYGGFRAARLVHRLQTEQGIAINGAFLISPVLEFATLNTSPYSPLAWALRLPSYAASALEAENRLSPAALGDVERFALGDYLTALASGPRNPAAVRRINDALVKYTGLPRDVVERQNARIPLNVFIKEFRRADGRLISRYDAGVSIADPFPTSPTPRGGDAVLQGTIAPFTTAFVAYARDELGFRTDQPYRLLNGAVSNKWDWRGAGGGQGFGGGGFAGSLDDLREALSLDPRLRVVIAHGMTDLVTPYFASRFLIDQLPKLGDPARVSLKLYAGGHMMYLRPAARGPLHRDALDLFRATGG
jgi:carboxypeptidase C (cathepsin A)